MTDNDEPSEYGGREGPFHGGRPTSASDRYLAERVTGNPDATHIDPERARLIRQGLDPDAER